MQVVSPDSLAIVDLVLRAWVKVHYALVLHCCGYLLDLLNFMV